MSEQKNIWRRSLHELMNESFGKYAKYIIQDRALPDIRDGLKPVQRRILYAMFDLGITSDKPYKKSARSVGEVIGKYHPHGDSSIYEAMVRMSQEWKLNMPLLDMHGNKGSIDGDSAAAMRYTECRLSAFSELMLNNIEKETINFIPNFDDSEFEPAFLPALIPNLLINGSTGIAAGYATNIPPYNISEVIDSIIYRIDNPNCTDQKIMKYMPGPDFPTGGTIQGISGIEDSYKTGRGKFIIRATIEERDFSKKIKQLVITEIPYETNKTVIIKAIDDLIFNERISGIIETRDESDKNGISIVLDIEIDKSFEVIKNFLYKNTPLQVTYATNFICIENRKPILMTITQAMDAYSKHAINIISKTAKFDLAKATKRLEILKGLIKAISILDDVIAIIRKSISKDDSKKNIINKFGFSEVQAEAIVQLRLYRLSATDVKTLKEEMENILNLIQELQTLLSSEEMLNNYLKKVLRDIKTRFGYKRKTKIEAEIQKIVINDADIMENKDVIVMITQDGYIKTTTKRSIEASTYGEVILKSGDILLDIFESNTLDQIILITNSGQYISVPCHKIKNMKYKEAAEHLNNIITLDSREKIIASFNTSNVLNVNKILMICTKNGIIKRVDLKDLNLSKNPKSSNVINLKDDDLVISACVLDQESNYDVICLTKNGLSLRFDINEVPIIGRVAAGVKAMKLLPNDNVVACIASNEVDRHNMLIVSNRGLKRAYISDITKTKRANIGRMVMAQVKSKPHELINSFICNSKDSVNILDGENNITQFKVALVPLTDSSSRVNDIKIDEIKACYRDNYISNDINYVSKTSVLNLEESEEENNDDNIIPEQGKLF